jgi:hypothetical protein
MLTNRVGMLTDVDGCNDIASKVRMTVIDLRRKDRIVDECNDV